MMKQVVKDFIKKHQDNIRGEKWTEIFSDMYYFSNLTQQDAEQFFDIMSDADIEISEHRYKYFDKLLTDSITEYHRNYNGWPITSRVFINQYMLISKLGFTHSEIQSMILNNVEKFKLEVIPNSVSEWLIKPQGAIDRRVKLF